MMTMTSPNMKTTYRSICIESICIDWPMAMDCKHMCIYIDHWRYFIILNKNFILFSEVPISLPLIKWVKYMGVYKTLQIIF